MTAELKLMGKKVTRDILRTHMIPLGLYVYKKMKLTKYTNTSSTSKH